MQNCPLCKKEYNDVAEVCPLKHCSNCGSLNLQIQNKRSFQSTRGKQNFAFVLPPVGFFVLVYGYIFLKGDLVGFLSIVAIYSVIVIAIFFKKTIKNVNCNECSARNLPTISQIKLKNAQEKQIDTLNNDKDLTQKISRTILDGLSKEQKKHNKKDILVRIVGATALVIIAIIGTFFVNPDNALLDEIIQIIKSLE